MTITRLWQSGAELGDLLAEVSLRDNATDNVASSITARTGTYSFRCPGISRIVQVIPTTDQFRVGFWFRQHGTPTANVRVPCIMLALSGSTAAFSVRFQPSSGTLSLFIGTTEEESIAIAFAQATWAHFGVDARLHNSAGWVVVYFAGEEVLRFEGDTTTAAGTVDSIAWGGQGASGTEQWNTGNNGAFVDDAFIDDTTGEAAPAPVPDIRLPFRAAAADGATSEFTPNGGTDHVDRVSQIPPDGDTTYLYAGSAGLRELFTIAAYTLPQDFAVMARIPVVVARKSNAGIDSQVRLVQSDGVDEDVGADQSLATSYLARWARFTLQPDGSEWDEAAVNSVEFGFESAGDFST